MYFKYQTMILDKKSGIFKKTLLYASMSALKKNTRFLSKHLLPYIMIAFYPVLFLKLLISLNKVFFNNVMSIFHAVMLAEKMRSINTPHCQLTQ